MPFEADEVSRNGRVLDHFFQWTYTHCIGKVIGISHVTIVLGSLFLTPVFDQILQHTFASQQALKLAIKKFGDALENDFVVSFDDVNPRFSLDIRLLSDLGRDHDWALIHYVGIHMITTDNAKEVT